MASMLVTGIGGFIGFRIAQLAKAKGYIVYGLELNPEAAEAVRKKEPDFHVYEGDICNQRAVEEAVKGANVVVHTAAIVNTNIPLSKARRVNVDGCLNVAAIAKSLGIETFVQLSSVMVYGYNFPEDVEEDGPQRGDGCSYCITKIEGEKELLKLNDSEFGVILIRPGDVYGPRCLPWVVRPMSLWLSGYGVVMKGGVMNHLYVDNLCDAIFLAIDKQAYGEAFNITDGCKTSWEGYWHELACISGVKIRFAPRSFSLSLVLLRCCCVVVVVVVVVSC